MRAQLPTRKFPDDLGAGFILRQCVTHAALATGLRISTRARVWDQATWSMKDAPITRHFSFRLLPNSDPYRTPSGRLRANSQVPYMSYVPNRVYFRHQRSDLRRTNAVCWHGHRDFLKLLFSLLPDLRVRTTVATYKGQDDFLKRHSSTYNHRYLSRNTCNC